MARVIFASDSSIGIWSLRRSDPFTILGTQSLGLTSETSFRRITEMADITEAQAGQLYKKAMALSHAALNKHSAHLPDDTHVHSLACSLIAGRHVQPGTVTGTRGPDRAGADDKQDGMLEDNYGGGQGGNF
jgi:hypothetical protein